MEKNDLKKSKKTTETHVHVNFINRRQSLKSVNH
jgi:hypothetical protein